MQVRVLVMLAIALAAGCARQAVSSTAQSPQRPPQRIVALMPSVAEDLYAIGAGPRVVAVSSYTDVPQAKALPRVADFSNVDSERIVALHPDIVVGIPSQARLVEPLRRAGIDVVLVPDDTYDDIFSGIRTIGALTGNSAQASALVSRLRRETAELHARTRNFPHHPTVFVVLGTGPIWTSGASSYIATLIALAGGVNAANDLPEAYGQYSAEALMRNQPDMLVTDPQIHLGAVLAYEPWRSLRAVRLAHVEVVDPASMIERPGPNYNDGLRWLVDRISPLAEKR
jgi:ABC-type Fe3+-hydroxamate transport system substrate-binding protein